jgi:hypothetical protein
MKMGRGLKLMAEYECHPLWWWETDIGNVDPAELPLPEGLRSELLSWASWYDSTLDQDYPPESGFKSEEDRLAFDREGRRLWRRLQHELPDFTVVYFTDLEQRLLLPDGSPE